MQFILDAREIDELFGMISESTIDFPSEGLDSDVWDKTADGYVLSRNAKATIMMVLENYPGKNLVEASKDIWVVGSICTNLHEDDADLDVHIHLKNPEEFSEQLRKDVMQWSKKRKKYVANNPIEVYVQDNPAQDLMSDGAYDVLTDTWLKGPSLVDQDYNPYEVYGSVLAKVEEFAKEADVSLGALKRDVIDYKVIQDAYVKLPDESKAKLQKFLDEKLAEIDNQINELLKDKKEWIDYRRSTPVTTNPEDVMKDLGVVQQWRDVNATFKFLNRYGLLKIISDLEQIRGEDKKVTHDEVPAVADVVGVTGV